MIDWKNIPDDELDEILRKSAESYTPPFDEATWKGLSEKLVARRKTTGRVKTYSYIVAGVFLAAVLLFFITRNPASQKNKTEVTKAQTGKKENTNEPLKPALQNGAIPEAGSATIEPPASPLQARSAGSPPKVGEPLNSSLPALSTDIPIENDQLVTLPAQNADAVAKENHLETENISSENTGESRGTDIRRLTGNIAPLTPKEISRAVLHLPQIRVSPQKEAAPPAPRQNGLALRVLYSPDFSTIGANKIFKVGNNIGVIGEYRFNKRWSVQAGVIKSLKYYSALPEQYASPYPPDSYLKDIDATCNMLDIPLNVRYDLVNTPLHKWFISTGATSYLMLKEKYSYNYENSYGASAKKGGWEGETGFYPFGVANISAGYERRLFKNFTVQAEPFFKVPLQNVGYGKVKLATFGLFISGKIAFPTQPRRGVSRIAF